MESKLDKIKADGQKSLAQHIATNPNFKPGSKISIIKSLPSSYKQYRKDKKSFNELNSANKVLEKEGIMSSHITEIVYQNKCFSEFGLGAVKSMLSLTGFGAFNSLISPIYKSLSKFLDGGMKYDIVMNRNKQLNNLYDNYKTDNSIGIVDKATQTKYYNKLNLLSKQTITLAEDSAKTPLAIDTHIMPYLALISIIVVKGVFILPGISVGSNKHDLEVVFDPTRLDSRGLDKDPFRTVIYKYGWPMHGFEIPYLNCRSDVENLILSVNKWFSLNPRYLCIRIR